MRPNFQRHLRLLVSAIGIALLGAVSLQAQDKTRVVTWPPYMVGMVQAGGSGSKISPVVNAVEIAGMEAGGHSIKVGQPFSADDDWLGTLTVKLKNISGQTITGAQISFGLPETQAPDQGSLMTTLRYGTSSSLKPEVPDKMVAPDEVFELKLTGAEYEQERNRILQRGLSTGVLKLWIFITMVTFEDGTHWSSACLKSSDPVNACP